MRQGILTSLTWCIDEHNVGKQSNLLGCLKPSNLRTKNQKDLLNLFKKTFEPDVIGHNLLQNLKDTKNPGLFVSESVKANYEIYRKTHEELLKSKLYIPVTQITGPLPAQNIIWVVRKEQRATKVLQEYDEHWINLSKKGNGNWQIQIILAITRTYRQKKTVNQKVLYR